jgi:hypothetical protein
MKKRDDLLKRIFSAYMVLRSGLDSSGAENNNSDFISMAVPTNTIDVQASLDGPFTTITAGTKICLDAATNKYKIYERNSNDSNTSTINDFYFCPFDIDVLLSPVRKVRYRYNMTDSSSGMFIVDADDNLFP